MCGPENTNRPRGGALVALSPPLSNLGSQAIIRGDLAFFTPGSPESTKATHARLTPNEACQMASFSDLYIVIHSTGDLTRRACDCGLFRRFEFPTAATLRQSSFVDLRLEKPLSLEVGDRGIIGRRVSLYSQPVAGTETVLAEGIVGYNYVNQESQSPTTPSSPAISI
ncbi:hypothetical protein G7046_g1315 [Stylonectria norvegica]|nr:hypothetical protein G7046_g1315 [Stylonectria norvegica]